MTATVLALSAWASTTPLRPTTLNAVSVARHNLFVRDLTNIPGHTPTSCWTASLTFKAIQTSPIAKVGPTVRALRPRPRSPRRRAASRLYLSPPVTMTSWPPALVPASRLVAHLAHPLPRILPLPRRRVLRPVLLPLQQARHRMVAVRLRQ